MPKKMNPILQRNKLTKELEKRGNPHHPTKNGDIEAALDYIDLNYYVYPENASIYIILNKPSLILNKTI